MKAGFDLEAFTSSRAEMSAEDALRLLDELRPGCPLGRCMGLGLYRDERGDVVWCQCALGQSRRAEHLKTLRVALRKDDIALLDNASWDWFREHSGHQNQEAYRIAVDFAQAHYVESRGQRYRHLLFYGPPGLGKTGLAACVARDWVEAGYPALFRYTPDLLGELRDSFSDDSGERESDIIRRHRAVSLLVLDDLGKEKLSERALEQMNRILAHRLDGDRATLLTSNVPLKTLERNYGEALAQRVLGNCLSVQFSGQSLRFGFQR